jgi:hypothetical protein
LLTEGLQIFHFGGDAGSNIYDSVTLGNVFVLSLPAFNWQNATNGGVSATIARSFHTCNVRNKQMIVVGGSTFTVAGFESINAEAEGEGIYWSNADPWPQGLGVFDLTEMVWAESYDPSAGPYATPKVVKEYYIHNPRYPDSLLHDPTLRDWFKVPQSSNNTTTPRPDSGSSKGSSNTGAIVGGVIGGVLVILLVAGISWLVLRHGKKRKQRQGQGESQGGEKFRRAELEALKKGYPQGNTAEMPDASGQWGRMGHQEADGRPMYEMEGGRPELST